MAKDGAKPAKDRGPLAEVRRLLDALNGSRLCYGEPVQAGGRTVIAVSRVRVSGGWGFGRGGRGAAGGDEGTGGGGGGHFDARPVGFIDIGPEGARYQDIPDPDRLARTLKAGVVASTAVVTGLAGARRLSRGRAPSRPRRLGR
jgi:uncharacterized spore protein YtfJ